MRIMFCNIGWMDHYNGQTEEDIVTYYKENVDEYDNGLEQYNFKCHNRKYYGYTNNGHPINIDMDKDINENVLVVWTSRDKDEVVKLVGWYKDATLYKSYQLINTLDMTRENIYYNIEVDACNTTLVPSNKRALNVYENVKTPEDIINKIVNYIENYNDKKDNFVFSDEYLTKETIDICEDYDAYINKGEEYELIFDNINAILYANKAINLDPKNENGYNLKGNTLLNFAMYDEAIKAYEDAFKVNNEFNNAIYNIGISHGLNGNNEEAIKYFDIFLEKESEDAYAIAYKGLCLLHIGNTEEAKVQFEKACELEPEDEWFNQLLEKSN